MFTDSELTRLLPGCIVEMIDVIGLEAALKLVKTHGGTHVWVPAQARGDHWLAEMIGLESLKKLCAYYGYTQIHIPRCVALLRAIKDKSISDGFAAGMTNKDLARAHGTTERTIRRIRSRVGMQRVNLVLDGLGAGLAVS
jgi:Mor family transcriptional regulator